MKTPSGFNTETGAPRKPFPGVVLLIEAAGLPAHPKVTSTFRCGHGEGADGVAESVSVTVNGPLPWARPALSPLQPHQTPPPSHRIAFVFTTFTAVPTF